MNKAQLVFGTENIYRTKNYIVVQDIFLETYPNGAKEIISRDTFTLRTIQKDREYEKTFSYRESMNGKRLHCTMCNRKYEL